MLDLLQVGVGGTQDKQAQRDTSLVNMLDGGHAWRHLNNLHFTRDLKSTSYSGFERRQLDLDQTQQDTQILCNKQAVANI